MDPDSKRLHVSVTDGRGRPVRDGGLGRWIESVAPPQARGALAVALASDAHVRALNRRYRRAARATDVLAFATEEGAPEAAPRSPQAGVRARRSRGHPRVLGDIVIAAGVARRQAREAGHAYATELRVLALHGLLHLLGYDHDAPGAGARMARAEARLRRKGGLRTGLIERTRAGAARGRHA